MDDNTYQFLFHFIHFSSFSSPHVYQYLSYSSQPTLLSHRILIFI